MYMKVKISIFTLVIYQVEENFFQKTRNFE
jgi:hypothetical protein